MNRHIRQVGVVCALLVFALIGNLTYLNLTQTERLENNPYNVRARDADANIHRGQILAGDLVIAESAPSTDSSVYRYQRVYANGPLYAPVTGFYSYIYATSRIENSFNAYLVGDDSSQWLQQLIDLASGRQAEGSSVVTTIDPTLQEAAGAALSGFEGAIVAMDPHSGAIKALVTSPSYDPNLLASHDAAAQQASWTALNDDPSRPMADRASRETYPPGSTFKLVVAATALEAGLRPDTMVETPERLQYPGSSLYLNNSTNCGDGEVTLTRALEMSCNTAFAGLAVQLGDQAIERQAERFGFNQTHLPELGGVASNFPQPADDAELMRAGIGQGSVTASPLQMAMVASTFLNNGYQAEPYIVEEVRAPDLTVSWRHQVEQNAVVSASTAQSMKDMMVSVVENGLGSPAKIPGVTVGGKSGTAQTDPSNPNYAWFVAFSLDPDLVVSVFLQRSESTSADLWGSGDAAPVAKAVLEAGRQ
ncbi:MAG: penicillin-binding protein 2 [Propionibacteriaceae bacterium]|nr:penicillin-binding protein 2 [Propionibacteriaceae bacterium]